MDYSNFLMMKEELSLIAVIVVLLLYDLCASKKALRYFQPVACVLVGVHTLLNLVPGAAGEAFGGMYQYTPMMSVVKSILNIGTLIVLMQAGGWLAGESTVHKRGEFYFLTLTTLLGMYFMISAGNFLFFFIGLETASIPMATLVAFDKYRHKSAEAGAKYILNAVFASGLSLYGMSLLYGTIGTLYFDDIPATVTGSPLQIMAFVFFAVGLFFKISLVPFHQWTPDVYEGAPTPVTSYLSVISKGSAVFVLMTILIKVFAPIAAQWQGILYGVIVVTITLANLFADPPKESQAFSGLFVDLAGRLHHARRDRRDGSRHDLARVLRARLHGVESGRLRRDRRDREPDRQADDSRLQRPLCDASEAEPRDDAGYVLAGRNTAFRGLLQQVLHLRRSRPAGLLYSGAGSRCSIRSFRSTTICSWSRRCSSTKTIRRSSRSAATAIRA